LKILLVGGTGQLGSDLLANNPGHEIIAPRRDQLDLTRNQDVTRVIESVQPGIVINCAAFHNVPACEQQAEQAFMVNCIALRDLAMACAARNVRLVTFSTDYVFSGPRPTPWREDDPPAPIQMYGITRLAGENAALANAPRHATIIRTCGLYGTAGSRSKGGNFVDARVADALNNSSIEMACEQVVSPTSTHDLSLAVFALVEHSAWQAGIYHLTNEGECSWYEFTREIFNLVGATAEVRPVDRGGCSGAMRRPLYSALANTKAKALGIALQPWKFALFDYLRRKYPDVCVNP
jgi:dTDP-4-dehydrorhamnose reductase